MYRNTKTNEEQLLRAEDINQIAFAKHYSLWEKWSCKSRFVNCNRLYYCLLIRRALPHFQGFDPLRFLLHTYDIDRFKKIANKYIRMSKRELRRILHIYFSEL
jgi:hypothetical protein